MGELATLASAALWAGASMVFASVGGRFPALAMNLVKTGLAFVGLSLTLLLLDGRAFPGIQLGNAGWVALSGLIGLTVGDTLFFASLSRLGTRRALILWALTPSVTSAMAWAVLGEPVGPRLLFGVLVTSSGVAVVLRARATGPTREGIWDARAWLGLAAGLGAVLCQAGGVVTAKLGGVGLSGLELSVARLGFGTLALVPLGLHALRRRGGLPERQDFLRVGIGTFIGTYLGMWLWMYGLQHAPAGVVATLESTTPVFALPLARLVYREPISASALFGALTAVLGVAILTLG